MLLSRNIRFVLLVLLSFVPSTIFSQVQYYSADLFPVIGKISDKTETRYERLPAELKHVTRPPVWKLGKNTSGLALRFQTNSTSIYARWDLLLNNNMNHMTDTGIKGLDLYALENNKWRFVNSARPTGQSNEQLIIKNMHPQEREYMLFLPLYDGVTSLQIGIDSAKTIKHPLLCNPDTARPVIVYGTSITQGGCATRPGMSYTNILTRRMNTEFINLGFSGNGKLDYEIAELIVQHKNNASLVILDFVANVSVEQIKEKMIPFVNIIRNKLNDIPILIIENSNFPDADFNTGKYQSIVAKNNELKLQYKSLKQKGYKHLYYLSSKDLIGSDGEATVDGTHFTDLGFIRFADVCHKKIRSILK